MAYGPNSLVHAVLRNEGYKCKELDDNEPPPECWAAFGDHLSGHIDVTPGTGAPRILKYLFWVL